MTDSFTNIENLAFTSKRQSGSWQVNFDDAAFGQFSSPPTTASEPGPGAAFGGSSSLTASAPLSSQWDSSAGGGFSPPGTWTPGAPPGSGTSSSAGAMVGNASIVSSSLPSSSTNLFTAAPMVHIRDRTEVAPAAPADLCSLAPPPPVTNRTKSTGDGGILSRQRPGTERGNRRYSSHSQDSHATLDLSPAIARSYHKPSLPVSQSFDSSSWLSGGNDASAPDLSLADNAASGTSSILAPTSGAAPASPLLSTSASGFGFVEHQTAPRSVSADNLLDGLPTPTAAAPATGPSTASQVDYLTSSVPMSTNDSRESGQADTASTPSSSDQWTISDPQREYYEGQFKNLADDQDIVAGSKARGFFLKSRLPPQELSQIWRLSDVNGDGALNIMEFCIAMQLVFARRRGATLPDTLPKPLLDFCEPRRAVPPLAAAAVAAPSPSQLPLIDQSPCQSDSESEDESHTKIAPSGSWQGSTMSSDTVDGGKPPTLPKPAAAKKPERPSQLPPRPANRHQESSDTRRPVVPVHNFGDAEFDDLGQLPPTRPEVPRANERQKSATLGRKPISEPSGTVWSTSAGDIIGHRDQAPEPAPRVPKRPTGHNRGSSMGDPRQFHNLHGSDASPPLPPREKHHTESQKAPTAQIAELESVLEGKTSEMKKKLESLASPVHRPLPAGAHPSPLADSGVPVASLAHAIQASQVANTRPSSDKVPSESKTMSPSRTMSRRVAKKPGPAAPAVPLHSPPSRDSSQIDVTAASHSVAGDTPAIAEEDVYASALPKSQRRPEDVLVPAATADTDPDGLSSGPSVKRKITKCRDRLLALSAINQELQTDLYQARERRLALQYELERLSGNQTQ